jgi:hypothetical protein
MDIPKKLMNRNDKLFEKLVPASGPTGTLEGEMLRSVNRLVYRWYNDGDYWYTGYGVETAGSAETFLRTYSSVDLYDELKQSENKKEEDYEKALVVILTKIIDYIEAQKVYQPCDKDMLDCKPKHEDRYRREQREDYYDE